MGISSRHAVAAMFCVIGPIAGPGPARADSPGGNELRVAAREGRVRDVMQLLERGTDPNALGSYGESALLNAALFNRVTIAKLLLERGADPNLRDDQEQTALMKAARSCAVDVSRGLLERDANPNLVDRDGDTALSFAALAGCPEVVGQLTGIRGIDLNGHDVQGNTALDYALTEAQIEVGGPHSRAAVLLLSRGAKTGTTWVGRTTVGTSATTRSVSPIP